MADTIEVKVPDIGDFKDVPVIEVLVKTGQTIKKNDALVTLESEKASMEVPAGVDGVVKNVSVKIGDKVSKGSVLLTLSPFEAPAQSAVAPQGDKTSRHTEVRAEGEPRRVGPINAAMQILSDGTTRSADEILAEAQKLHLLASDYKAKYVYTALIEYIARANGNGRKPYIVQDENRNFRINEPPDDWPNLNPPPPRAPDPQAQALVARLATTATGSDPAAFEVAVCDAFAHMGFLTNHVGGNKAPDGYGDAILGPLGYRVMFECKTGKGNVTQPDAFEAAKYKDAFHAQYCTLIGPAFPDEVELTQELKTHGVSAWTLDDLTTALLAGANANELRPCFEPGYAADGLMDLLWNRDHGMRKRVRVVAALIQQVGWDLQTTAARTGTPADAPLLTVDTAMALVDQALACLGSMQGCTREQLDLAFQHLTNPVNAVAATADSAVVVLHELRPRG